MRAADAAQAPTDVPPAPEEWTADFSSCEAAAPSSMDLLGGAPKPADPFAAMKPAAGAHHTLELIFE